MPSSATLEFRLLCGNVAIPEYDKDNKTYVECNLNTPCSYTQALTDAVAGEIEKQEWPVTPYRILIKNLDEAKTYYIRVFIDGVKVKALSLTPLETKVIKGFKDGAVLKEFLFSMPRFATDETDRLVDDRASDVGMIRVESWNAERKNSKWRMRDQELSFVQANKKDSTKVTNGEYTMATSKVGKAIADRSVLRRVDSWKRTSLEASLSIQYHMCHTLQSMGFDLKPFPTPSTSSALLADVKVKLEGNTAAEAIKIDDDEGVFIDLTEDDDTDVRDNRATRSSGVGTDRPRRPDKAGSSKKSKKESLSKRKVAESQNADIPSKKGRSGASLSFLVDKLSDVIAHAPPTSAAVEDGDTSSDDANDDDDGSSIVQENGNDSSSLDDSILDSPVTSPDDGSKSSDAPDDGSKSSDEENDILSTDLIPSSPASSAENITSPDRGATSPKRVRNSPERDVASPKRAKMSSEKRDLESENSVPSPTEHAEVEAAAPSKDEATNSDEILPSSGKETTSVDRENPSSDRDDPASDTCDRDLSNSDNSKLSQEKEVTGSDDIHHPQETNTSGSDEVDPLQKKSKVISDEHDKVIPKQQESETVSDEHDEVIPKKKKVPTATLR